MPEPPDAAAPDRNSPPPTLEERHQAADRRAMDAIEAGDLAGAERELRSLLPAAEAENDLTPLFLHYELALLHWAARDQTRALAEMDASDAYLRRPEVGGHSAAVQRLNVLWLRAFLLLEDAKTRARAEAVRKEHEAAAGNLGERAEADLLGALFAVRSGNRALATQRSKSFSDLEPDALELLVMHQVYRAIGNAAEAQKAQQRIQEAEPGVGRLLVLRRLKEPAGQR